MLNGLHTDILLPAWSNVADSLLVLNPIVALILNYSLNTLILSFQLKMRVVVLVHPYISKAFTVYTIRCKFMELYIIQGSPRVDFGTARILKCFCRHGFEIFGTARIWKKDLFTPFYPKSLCNIVNHIPIDRDSALSTLT